MPYQQRIKKIQQSLKKKKIQAYWVVSLENCSYLTGLCGYALFDVSLLITPSKCLAISNALYTEALAADRLETVEISQSLLTTLGELLEQKKIKQCAVEEKRLSYFFFNKLKSKIAKVKFILGDGLIESFRLLKDKEELKTIKKACGITDEALAACLAYVKPGVTEKHLAWIVEKLIREAGADDVSFRPLIVAAGCHSSRPHHVPSDHKIRKRDLIQFDIGALYQGYSADLSRVVILSSPTSEQTNVYDVVRQVQKQAIAQSKPGASAALIDRECKKVIEKLGYPSYPHGLGHGVGLAIHEDPVLADRPQSAKIKLKNGMTFTIEPAIYLAGKFGVRIEDVVSLQDGKTYVLSKAPKDLIVI